MFLFTVFVSQHAAFEALVTRTSFPAFLDKFVGLLKLSRGIRIFACTSWEGIDSQYYQESGTNLYANIFGMSTSSTDDPIFPVTKHSYLLKMINSLTLDLPGVRACSSALCALESLGRILANQRISLIEKANFVLQWQIRIPREYIRLLEQKRPEALVILAHYGMMINQLNHYWLFRDSGKYIVQSVTMYLGPVWSEWLILPNKALERGDV